MQKLEQELWNLVMKDTYITAYTKCFNDIATLCPTLVIPEHTKIERYILGLVQLIQGLVIASKPTSYDSSKRLAFNLINQKIIQSTKVQKDDLSE